MPNNVPAHLTAKFERCLEDVVATGKDKDAAYAICYTSVVEAPLKLLAIMQAATQTDLKPLSEAARYTPKQDALADLLQQRGVLEAGARHTRREFEIIEQVIQLMTELYGEIDDLGAFIDRVTTVTEALGEATVIDHLISILHRSFTDEADYLVGTGARLDQSERIFLSHAIGAALDAFNACVDAEMPNLRDRLLYKPIVSTSPTPATIVNVTPPAEVEVAPAGTLGEDDPLTDGRGVQEAAATPRADRDLIESVLGNVGLDAAGNLIGTVVIEGRSDNGNIYTEAALKTVPAIFAGAQMFVNHPTMSEEMERPEGDLYDLVGRLPQAATDFYIDTVMEGKFAGRKACFFRNGFISETADWLKTKIREGLAGDMSIRAQGRGYEEGGDFVVEAFSAARSLDFVTRAAAGGRAQLMEATRRLHESALPLMAITLEQFVEARPDLAAALGARERETLQEANRMANVKLSEAQKQIVRLRAALRNSRRAARKSDAERIIGETLAGSGLPAEAQTRVKSLAEASVRRFVEADPQPEPPGELAPAGGDLNPGDPATIELPPDVAELPQDAQRAWLETYVVELPKGEPRAVNLAWAAVYAAGWVKGEQGWYTEQATQPVLPPDAMPIEPVATTEALRAAVKQIVAGEKAYIANMSEAGKVTTMGGGGDPVTEPGDTDARLTESYKRWGLTDAQAKVAVEGR